MFRIDNSTVAANIPTPNPAGTPGYFTNGNPVTGAAATIVDADFLNRVQEELLAPLTQAAVTPAKGTSTQLLQSLKRLYGGNVATITTTTVLNADHAGLIVITSGSSITLTMPAASAATGAPIPLDIINLTGSSVTIAGAGADTIESGATTTIAAGTRASFLSNGVAKWYCLSTNANGVTTSRVRLVAPLDLYVATTGNDANNGLTSGAPFATLQAAWNSLAYNYDMDGQVATIHIADGTYTSGIQAGNCPVGNITPANVIVTGNAGTPSNVLINVTNGPGFTAVNQAGLTIQNLKIQASGSGGVNGIGLYASFGQISFSNIVFGACGSAHITANILGFIGATGNYSITAAAPQHILAEGGGVVNIPSIAVTITGTPAFSTSFANATFCAQIQATGATFVGSATGVRYNAAGCAAINTNGGGSTFFPGNSAGTTSSNGVFV